MKKIALLWGTFKQKIPKITLLCVLESCAFFSCYGNQKKGRCTVIFEVKVKIKKDAIIVLNIAVTYFNIDLFEEVTKSQASGWVEAEDYKMPPVPMHFYRLVTLDSFFGHCCFLIIFRSVCLQLIGFSEWELLDKYMKTFFN